MRKHLTAKLFKRLSLVALVVSVGVWGASQFCSIGVLRPTYLFDLSQGKIRFAYDPLGGLYGPTLEIRMDIIGFRRVHSPPPGQNCFLWNSVQASRIYSTEIHLWLTSLIGLLAFLVFRRREQRIAIAPGCCVHCGYDASRCTDNRCSECGEPFGVEAAAAG